MGLRGSGCAALESRREWATPAGILTSDGLLGHGFLLGVEAKLYKQRPVDLPRGQGYEEMAEHDLALHKEFEHVDSETVVAGVRREVANPSS